MNTRTRFCLVPSLLASLALAQPAGVVPSPNDAPLLTPAQIEAEWRAAEAPFLTNQTQLTFPDRFIKAGEAYFSPDGNWIIFQAIEHTPAGTDPDPFYSMYVARLDRTDGTIKLTNITRVSPKGSANTCGWFDPRNESSVIFGSTLVRPADEQKSGFQVGTRKYVWQFPDEMEVVTISPFSMIGGLGTSRAVRGNPQDLSNAKPEPIFTLPNYDAECSFSKDGRFLLYSHVEDRPANVPLDQPYRPDANIYIFDRDTHQHYPIVTAAGYDGGPFFHPNDGFICYRSDRKGNDLLQIFVADLKHETDANGVNIPVGIENEWQLTDNDHVNWCPFWHPSGALLVYATSEVSHSNYEIFGIESIVWKLRAGEDPKTFKHTRITFAPGADVLPAFNKDGSLMMWTSQRGAKVEGEAKPSSQLWIATVSGSPWKSPAPDKQPLDTTK